MISPAGRESAGIYTCTAHNKLGVSGPREIQLDVECELDDDVDDDDDGDDDEEEEEDDDDGDDNGDNYDVDDDEDQAEKMILQHLHMLIILVDKYIFSFFRKMLSSVSCPIMHFLKFYCM